MDFIVYGEMEFYAIEVKHSTQIKLQDLRALNEFKKDYPESCCILLYRGKEKYKKGHILCCPVEDFLRNMLPNQALVINS